MIESVVALLMFVNAEIKEARLQSSMAECLRGKRCTRSASIQNLLCTNAGRVKQN